MISLNPADGATFHAMIEEMPDGMWRASGLARLDEKSQVQEQTLGMEMCPTELTARAWVNRVGALQGFKSCKLEVRRQVRQ